MADSLLVEDDSHYDIILSGVPFGSVSDIKKYDYASYQNLTSLEAMFLKHTMRKLVKGGKAALIIPDGILFNRNKGLVDLRRELLTEFNLHSILSLPSGVLAPYVGVKVSVLFFDNAVPVKDIWIYKLEADKSLNKTNQITESDLIEFTESFSHRKETVNSCMVDKRTILNSEYLNLSIDLPKKVQEINYLKIKNEMEVLKERNDESTLLLSQICSTLNEGKKANSFDKIAIGELFTIKSGKALTKSEIKEQDEYPVYGGNGIIGYYNAFSLKGENVLIGRVGSQCGNIHYVKGPIWVTQNSFSIQLNTSLKVHMPYLAHVLRSLNLNKSARGSAQLSISYAKIKDIELSLPTYRQQLELSDWFERIQMQNKKILQILDFQAETLNELSNYTIISNCVEENTQLTYLGSE